MSNASLFSFHEIEHYYAKTTSIQLNSINNYKQQQHEYNLKMYSKFLKLYDK